MEFEEMVSFRKYDHQVGKMVAKILKKAFLHTGTPDEMDLRMQMIFVILR